MNNLGYGIAKRIGLSGVKILPNRNPERKAEWMWKKTTEEVEGSADSVILFPVRRAISPLRSHLDLQE